MRTGLLDQWWWPWWHGMERWKLSISKRAVGDGVRFCYWKVSDGFQSWRPRLTKIPNGILRKKIRWGKGREASDGFCLEYVELEVLHWQSRGDLVFCSCASNSSQDWGSCGSSHVVVAETLREAIICMGEDWMLLFMALLRPALNGFRLLMNWKNRSYEAKWENKAAQGKTGSSLSYEGFVLAYSAV